MGDMLIKKSYIPLFIILIIALVVMLKKKLPFYLLIISIISLIFVIQLPVNQLSKKLEYNKSYNLNGKVASISNGKYYTYVTLEDASVNNKKMRCSINIKVKKDNSFSFKKKSDTNTKETQNSRDNKITLNDKLTAIGELSNDDTMMNPSDFNYKTYLKYNNVGASFKVKSIERLVDVSTLKEKVHDYLKYVIEKLYPREDVSSIIKGVILGDKSDIDENTRESYNLAGIGHLLCISGFHIGVVYGILMYISARIGLSYEIRRVVVIMLLGVYTYFTGASVQTIRAFIIIAMILSSNIIWEEADLLTSLGIASLITLVNAPYQVFNVGFQLSYVAVITLNIARKVVKHLEKKLIIRPKIKKLIYTLCISIFSFPICSYFFYNISVISILLNLIAIPVFSVIIIGSLISIGLFIIKMPICYLASKLVTMLFDALGLVIKLSTALPFANVIIGRLDVIRYGLYVLVLIAAVYMLLDKLSIKNFKMIVLISLCVVSMLGMIEQRNLAVTALYVGQGDSLVVEVPGHKLLVFDGGNEGEGQTLENYIKYRGYSQVEAAFISHFDADHITGIIELIEGGFRVNKVFISTTAENKDLEERLYKACDERKIKVARLNQGDRYKINGVSVDCLAPNKYLNYNNENNRSLVCLLKYKNFKALFTGDKEKESDFAMYDNIGDITLLKVSHHGSRTGTSKELLDKLKPEYAVISCGINNLYHHPHNEVTQLLEEARVDTERTDISGAISYITDGKETKEVVFRKDISDAK